MYDDDGKKTWSAELDIYGRVRTFDGRSLKDCPFRFQGQYEDAETGLYYNRFRYYDPSIGNYLSQDPIGLLGGSRLYGYVHDTNNWLDEFGLAAANGGNAAKHGGTGHNNAIDDEIARLQKDPSVSNIRKNQQQVDVNGNKAGNNRPDIQYDKGGVHHNVEYDTTKAGSTKHQNQIGKNDPNSRNTFWQIDEKGNVITGHSQLPQKGNPSKGNSSNAGTANSQKASRTKGSH
jgi:RHS repeat-associated protein